MIQHGNPRMARKVKTGAPTACSLCFKSIASDEWRYWVRKWRLTQCHRCKRDYARLMNAYRGRRGVQNDFDEMMQGVLALATNRTLAWATLVPLLIEDARRAHNKEAV